MKENDEYVFSPFIDDEYNNPIQKEIYKHNKIIELQELAEQKKKRNRTYLKGQYGVRRYYDYDKQKEISDDILEIEDEEEYQKALIDNRPIKCVFKKDLRREKLYMYLKYLNGRKVLIRDLAWKFAVTERTLQSDLKYLIENEYIERKINRTYKNRETKNSFIVNPKKSKDFAFTGENYLVPILLLNNNNEKYILTKTEYTKEKVVYRKVNISDFDFCLPFEKIRNIKRAEIVSKTYIDKVLGENIDFEYKGIFYSYISKGIDRDEYNYNKIIEKWNCRYLFSLIEIKKEYPIKDGYRWIKLSTAPRRINDFVINKGLHYLIKNNQG